MAHSQPRVIGCSCTASKATARLCSIVVVMAQVSGQSCGQALWTLYVRARGSVVANVSVSYGEFDIECVAEAINVLVSGVPLHGDPYEPLIEMSCDRHVDGVIHEQALLKVLRR